MNYNSCLPCRSIKIERDSVNSVSFNPEPQDPHTSMLVAANLTVGQKSDVVHARNTTLMPKIPGLPTLVCLLFCPYAEIRYFDLLCIEKDVCLKIV